MARAEWAGIAGAYDRSFALLCAGPIPALLDRLGEPIAEGVAEGVDGAGHVGRLSGDVLGARDRTRLLDAGTGTGRVAVAAAERGWAVDAFDAEPSMIEYAAAHRPRNRSEGQVVPVGSATGIRYAVAALPAIPYPDGAFDAVAANFCLNHIDDPRDGVRELARVTRAGGRIAATVWPWGRPSPLAQLWRGIQEETGTSSGPSRLPANSDFERSEAGLAGLLESGGFVDAAAATFAFDFAVDPGDLWAGVEAGIALIGYAYEAASAAQRTAMSTAYERRLPNIVGHDGRAHFAMTAILAAAVKPTAA
ncbi:class I SAM-dependent methyltransferase [Gryllotalpicola sp.]|uniref:class I SAM-dependent methyltransferase n=1 Tax=Gryllotalpicola sp. TaxID=1932787 RepID=UPI0026240D1E|nr:class I SAM-dependent methyltransferase [Gryllotalpicola sp.]